ncbi:MAG: immunoglobulin domain-containing protein, partial [Bacteroidota bacterium]
MNRRHFYKLFSFLVFLILSLQIVVIQELRGQCDPTTDLNTLKALYNAGWRLNGWNNTETNPANMANWEGVFLSDDGCVKELNVGGKNLAELASNNGGDRSIPTAIGGFTNLKLLWLNNNGFTGVIPEVLFNISRVDRNNANSNSKLTNLYLQQNNFTPSTLTGFAKLVNLVTFGFDRNKSPFSEANFPDLTNVDEVDQFFIRNHDFNDIPNFKVSFTKSPGNPSGRNIEVSGNRLTFEDLMRFAELSEPLDGFYFFPQNPFRVAQNTYDLTEGDDLNINLGVDENVNGNIYKWFKDGNEIPNKTTNPLTIQNVAIEDAGTYYCEVTNATFDQNTQKYIQNGNNSQSLVLTSENIVVTVNANEEINCRRDAEVLEKLIDANFKYDDTWKKDDIKNFASWAGIKTNNEGCIIALDLTERNITGPIPAEIGDLADLEELKLGNNQITGDLPATFAKLNKLKILHLAENNLGGNLAEYQVIFDITSLEELLLYSNNIGGTIPSSIAGSNPNEGLSQNLNFLSIGDNNLTGTIPNELYNLTKLTKLHLNLNQLTGGI